MVNVVTRDRFFYDVTLKQTITNFYLRRNTIHCNHVFVLSSTLLFGRHFDLLVNQFQHSARQSPRSSFSSAGSGGSLLGTVKENSSTVRFNSFKLYIISFVRLSLNVNFPF